jgi:hypothetical protein
MISAYTKINMLSNMMTRYWVINFRGSTKSKVCVMFWRPGLLAGVPVCQINGFFFRFFVFCPCGSGMCLHCDFAWRIDCFRDKQGPSSNIHWNQMLFMHQILFLILGFASFGTYDLWGCLWCMASIINTFRCFYRLLADIGTELSLYWSDVFVNILD